MSGDDFLSEEARKEKEKQEDLLIKNSMIPNELVVICKSYKQDLLINLGSNTD